MSLNLKEKNIQLLITTSMKFVTSKLFSKRLQMFADRFSPVIHSTPVEILSSNELAQHPL